MPVEIPRLLKAAAVASAFALYACGPVEPSVDERCQGRLPGDLVVSEFMNDPSGKDSESHEWVELFNATGEPVDLKSMTLVVGAANGSGDPKEYVFKAASIPPGSYFVVGNSKADPRPTYEDQSYGDSLGDLRNSDGLIQIKCGTKLIDEVRYTDPAGKDGHSNELDGAVAPDSAVNDTETSFCASNTPLGDSNFGTPGEKNAECGTVGPRTCTDPVSQQKRTVVTPAAGELVITEYLPDPGVVSDTGGEWIELHAPSRTVDLNGLIVESGSNNSELVSDTCITVATGAYVLLARSETSQENGGLPFVTALYSASLGNQTGAITIRDGDTVIDTIQWTQSTSGAATQLNPDARTATLNDDEINWCPAISTFGQGDLGTPGAANDPCPPIAGECFDTTTGSERAIVKPAPGDLVITELMQNPAGTDGDGEWVEITALTDVDLNDLRLEAAGSGGFSGVDLVSNDCLRLGAGTYAIVASESDSALNGGLPFVTWTRNFSLNNTAGRFRIVDGTTVLDEVSWTDVTGDASWQLDGTKLSPVLNDDPANLCPGQDPYGNQANTGSPGAANHACAPLQCMDTGTMALRDLVLPQPGDLVISEVHAAPLAVAETAGEFIEIFVKNAVDLNDLRIANEGTGSTTLTGTDCIPVAAGSYIVLARNSDQAMNGGIANVFSTFNFPLDNFGTTTEPKGIFLRRGSFLLEAVTWTQSTAGVSSQLSNDKLDATLNDDMGAFCDTATGTTYGDGDRGSPGLANGLCP